jgi:hypothetical protein
MYLSFTWSLWLSSRLNGMVLVSRSVDLGPISPRYVVHLDILSSIAKRTLLQYSSPYVVSRIIGITSFCTREQCFLDKNCSNSNERESILSCTEALQQMPSGTPSSQHKWRYNMCPNTHPEKHLTALCKGFTPLQFVQVNFDPRRKKGPAWCSLHLRTVKVPGTWN